MAEHLNNQLTAAAHVRDGGGTIDSSEVTEMLRGLFSMAGVSRVQGGGGYKLAQFRIILRDFLQNHKVANKIHEGF